MLFRSSNSGDPEAYLDFREVLQQLPMPYHPLIGKYNHRDIFAEIFLESSSELTWFFATNVSN